MRPLVVGGSRGLGRGIVEALADSGMQVGSLSRNAPEEPRNAAVRSFTGDATSPDVAREALSRYGPSSLVLAAGAVPHMATLQNHSWESFSEAWTVDVRIAFEWTKAVLTDAEHPVERVITISSGAALAGSPLSGGYAGAKATQRFISRYAQIQADKLGRTCQFSVLLPRFAPETAVGREAVSAYAQEAGLPASEFLKEHQPVLTPEVAGKCVLDLLLTDNPLASEYLLSGAGVQMIGPASG